jgi:hypothetical protein
MVSGNTEVYIGYRMLYGRWCMNNAAVQGLRPLFRIPGVEPDGVLSADEDFKLQVLALAKTIIPRFSD